MVLSRREIALACKAQNEGSDFADALNVETWKPEDLMKHVPYPHYTLEALAWSSGYWASIAGQFCGIVDKQAGRKREPQK